MVWRELGISIARSMQPQMDGYEIWVAPENVDKVWDALAQAGATLVGTDALELYRIARGVPRYGVDLRERDLPQETGQQHALNFSKGCYIGQEIVERIRARGNVHRAFVGFEVAGRASAGLERKFALTTKKWARSPARRASRFPVASEPWPWAICGVKSQLRAQRSTSADEAQPYKHFLLGNSDQVKTRSRGGYKAG